MLRKKYDKKGITLIALVVTIVVLLILAGITISLVFGSNGVIQKAQDSKEQTKIGEMREKLEMAKVPVYADGNGSYKVQDYWGRIESEGLIADKTVDIIDNGDGTYEVTTTPGYVFEITVEPNKEIAENIIIGECIGKGENLSIGIRVVKKTTNSIEIEVVRVEGASNFKYSIKKQGEEYGAAEEKSETRHVFSGLTQGGIYTIKVEATKDGEQQIVEKTLQVGEIPLAIDGDVIWTGNGQASVRIYTEEEGYQLEWQKNEIVEGSWTRETSGVKEKTITGLVNGDIIYARLYDGVSSGKYANIEVADNTPPEIIRFEAIEVTSSSIRVEVEAKDEESGLHAAETYQYYLEGELKETSEEAIYIYEGLNSERTYKVELVVKNTAGQISKKSIIVKTKTAIPIEEVLTADKITYVNFADATGVKRKCVVLYDSSSEYGIEIITMDTVKDTSYYGKAGYDNYVSNLNNEASKYINDTSYADKIRSVGSSPRNGGGSSGTYTIDLDQMNKLGIQNISKKYWLASYHTYGDGSLTYYYVRYINNSGNLAEESLYQKPYSGSGGYASEYTCGLRPVFHLKSGTKVVGGDGTEDNPYELGV